MNPRLALGLSLLALSCSTRNGEPDPQAPPSAAAPVDPCPAPNELELRAAPSSTVPSGPLEKPATASEPSKELPAGVLPGVPAELPVSGDRPVRVVHGGPANPRALVYLHGMCGNPEAMDDWSPLASHYGTLVVLRADVPCGDRPGFKWPTDVALIQARIDRALRAVASERGDLLDERELVLIGYSQGAHRAERLAEAYPERYPYLILGGPPGVASPRRLARARAVAILGGEREDTSHMQAGFAELRSAGLRARFFTLPGVGHGAYGPRAPQVLGEAFAWLLE